MSVTKQDLHRALEQEPFLCAWGLGNPFLFRKNRICLETDRQELMESVRQFQLCCGWLSTRERRKTINPSIGTSYGLKHIVEAWAGEYVCNGAFIAAVIHLGIKYQVRHDNPNIRVALSSRNMPFIIRRGDVVNPEIGRASD